RSTLHDELHSLQFRDVFERVARNRDHVGELPGLNRANPVCPSHHFRENSRAFCPWGNTPASVPKGMGSSAFSALAKLVPARPPSWRCRSISDKGTPKDSPCSTMTFPTNNVGT